MMYYQQFPTQTANDVLSIHSSQHRPQKMYYQYIAPNTDRKRCIINTHFLIHFINLNTMLPFTNNFFTMISCLRCYRVRFTLIRCSQLLPSTREEKNRAIFRKTSVFFKKKLFFKKTHVLKKPRFSRKTHI